ncbi:MAG: caspase family protein [Bacteroidales bacterium]|nr:caspase family protein [Bacteroidales bacterium]
MLIGVSQINDRGFSKIVKNDDVNDTYAIIIGISDYKEVDDLQYADKDAIAYASFLMSETGGAIDSANIMLFLNEDAIAVNIGSALEQIGPKLTKSDRLIIFFAGHGDIETANQNNGLLLLYKAPKSSYWSFSDDYLKVSDLRNISQVLASKEVEVVIISDACKSGKLAGGTQGSHNTSLALSESWANEIKILSCQPDELSQEGLQWGGGHGLFSYYLIYGLYGLADKNNNGEVSLIEIENYLEENVTKDAAPAFQTPFTVGNLRRVITYIDQEELTAIQQEKSQEIPLMAMVNTKGVLDQLLNNPDTTIVSIYKKYEKALDSGNLILPPEHSAVYYYEALSERLNDENVKNTLKRNLAASLQDNAMEIILPILKLEKFDKKTIEEYNLAALELEKVIELLGEGHYLVNSLQVRKLFLEAYALSEEFEQLYADKTIRDTSYLHIAKEKLFEAIKIDSNAAYPYFQLGWIAIRQNEIIMAIEIFAKYTELVPNNKRAYNNLGYAYECIDDTINALYNYRKSIELDSNYAKPYTNIGAIYGNMGNMKKAETYFKLSIQKDTLFTQGYFNLGLVYFFTNKYNKSKKCFEKVIDINAENFDSYYYLSAIYSIENNQNKAIQNLEKALESGFDDLNSLENDSYLDNIRNTKQFKKLIKQYFK